MKQFWYRRIVLDLKDSWTIAAEIPDNAVIVDQKYRSDRIEVLVRYHKRRLHE